MQLEIGARVVLINTHPHAGKAGEIVRNEEIPSFGLRPVVRLDDGIECFIMRDTQYRPVEESCEIG